MWLVVGVLVALLAGLFALGAYLSHRWGRGALGSPISEEMEAETSRFPRTPWLH